MGQNLSISSNDIFQELPELKYYQLEFLIRSKRIEVNTFGRGIPREFPPNTIQKIKSILQERIES